MLVHPEHLHPRRIVGRLVPEAVGHHVYESACGGNVPDRSG